MSKDKIKKDKKSKKDKKDVKSKNGTYKKTGGADKKHDEVRGRENSGRTEVRGGKQQGTLISGVYRGTGKGFAFLTPDDGGEDLFIPPRYMGGALNGDRVTALVTEGRDGRREAHVKEVTQETTVYVVGTYAETKDGRPAILPDDGKVCRVFLIENKRSLKPKQGYKVVGLPLERDGDTLFGDLVEVLGTPDLKNVDILSVARAYGLEEEFPPEVAAAARAVEFEVPESAKAGREDFRGDIVVTIDGLDAKDLDDAVSVVKKGGNYILSVHIADVSHYVKEGGVIDKEAFRRATSVYFPGSVFPMLPRELSNGICSLNPQVDRLTLSCIMEIDKGGNVINSRIVKGLIKTRRRMDYDNVAAILTGDEKARAENADVCEMLDTAKELALILNAKRRKRGSIEFELPESKIILDDNGKCVDVQLYEHKISHMVVEEFMLAANETVAATFDKLKIPFVYRVHEAPPPDKELAYIDYLETLGISFSGGAPRDWAALFESVKDKEEGRAVNRIGLRAMSKAKYMTKDAGHFGLAAPHYCHFTSPIRRYPDLQIHRIISDWLAKGTAYVKQHYAKIVAEAATQSSVREQIAMAAERRADDLKKAEYMKAHVGEVFDGTVSSVTEWGLFVELPNCIEGLIRKDSLGEDMTYNEKSHTLTSHGEVYYIGKPVRVRCRGAESGKVDFEFADAPASDASSEPEAVSHKE